MPADFATRALIDDVPAALVDLFLVYYMATDAAHVPPSILPLLEQGITSEEDRFVLLRFSSSAGQVAWGCR